MTTTIQQLMENAGAPLDLARMWDSATEDLIAVVCEQTIAAAQRQPGIDDTTAVMKTVLGMYAQAFMVGREHGRLGLTVPGRARRDLAGLDPGDLSSIVIPADLRDL